MRSKAAPAAPNIGRRDLLAGLTAALFMTLPLAANGCGGAPLQPPPAPPPPPDRVVQALTDLMTVVKLEWLILLSPEELWSLPWLRGPLGRILRGERLDLLAQTTGVDLRQCPELALASYRDGEDGTIAYLVRHRGDALDVERRFRLRLTSGETRRTLAHQLVGVWGNIGTKARGLATVGRDVAVYQFGGRDRSGPARLATLYARNMLRAPTALADRSLANLDHALGPAPAKLLIPGPFEGEHARGARGLLAAASAVGATLAPSEERSLVFRVVMLGDYGPEAEQARALRFLELAWKDLADADLGHLLGLHQAMRLARAFTLPSGRGLPSGLSLDVELDPDALFDGLAAATVQSVREFMR